MSGRRSKKNQRLGSSRRGPKGLNRNIEKDDDEDDGFQQIPESGDGQNKFHTVTDYHSTQFDLPPSSSIDQQTSGLESPPHGRSLKDLLMETELPERKRKMGSTRKSAGGFKVERNLEMRTTEDLDEYVTQSNTSASEEQHPSLTEDEQSRSSFSSNLSLQTESSGLEGEPQATLMVAVSETEEKDAMHHQEVTFYSYKVVSDTPIDKAMGGSVYSGAATVAESDLLREDSVMFNELNTLSRQETPLASKSGQKRKIGSTRRPLGGKNTENVVLQEHSRSMTENERKAEVIDEAKFSMSEEMVQTWDDVARDDPSSHTESSLVSNQSLLTERAELNKPDVSVGTETMNQSVAFPLVDPEKPLPETSSHHGTPLLNKGLDFEFGSNIDFDVPNKGLEEAGSNLSDDNQHVSDTRNDTNTSHNCKDVNTVEGKEVLKQKEEPSRNNKTSSLSPRQDAQLEELVLNCEKSPSLRQNNNFDHSTVQLIEGGNSSFDMPASNISHAKPTTTSSPHEMSDAVEESQEIYVEMKHKNNVCDVASCDTLTDLECDEDERGSDTDNGFEITVQGDARDHNVTQIIMEVRNNKEDGGKSAKTILISNQDPCEVSTEKEELHREQEQEYSSTVSRTQSGPPQDNAGKMLEIKEVREGKEETETTVINDVTSKSEEMLSFEDSATETGSHENQQLFMQSRDKEGYDLSESGYEEIEKQVISFSAESENAAFDKSVGSNEEAEGIEGMDAAVLKLDVEKRLTYVNTVFNDCKSDLQTENPEQNKVLTEEQNYASPDINLEAFQISDNISTVIDSSVILQLAVGREEKDTVNEESDISPVIPADSQNSYKLRTFHSETQENEGDTDIVPVGGDTDLEIQTRNKTFYSSTSEAVGTEEKVREFEVNGETVTVKRNRTTKSDFLQTSSEALKVSENPENEGSSDINIILEDTHREEAHTKSSPVVYKRKMGSTRRPLKGNKGQRKGMKYHDENETLDSECMINVEKDTFNLEDEPSPNKSTSQSSKDGVKEQEMEICEKKDVGPVEGSESNLKPSSFSLDSVSEESTAVTITHITETQTFRKINEESRENTGDAERVPAEGDAESHSEIQTELKPTDLTTSEAERTEESIPHATVLVEEVDFIVDTVTVESNKSDLLQYNTVTVANLETFKVSANIENVSSVTDTGLLVQDDPTEGSGETNTIPDESDTNIIPEDTHREETHSKSSPIVHKRKMGSTRRPLKGNKGQRKGIKYHDENETLDGEATKHVEKETFSLEDEPSLDESSSQSSKDGAKEQEMEICGKKDVGPVEGSESNLIHSSFSLDSVSEESTAVTISHITESQTLTKMNEESQENTGDAERVPAEGDAESHSEIQTEIKPTDLTTFEAERTEESIRHATVLVKEVEFIVDTVTVESNMTESDLLQNDTVTVANLETLKVSENIENVSSVTDTGLLVPDDPTEGSGETNTIPDESDTNIIPEDTHREETHSKSSPIVHKRKMGSTLRPLKGNKGQRNGMKYHDEYETLDTKATMNVEKETFSLEDEPSLAESSSQSSKDGAKEQEMEICEKKDAGPVEGSESGLIQSSFSLDSVSEESTAVTIPHITESQTLTKINEESQENTGDAERGPAEGDAESHSEIQTEIKPTDLTTFEAERTEESIRHATVLVEEVEFIVDTVTVERNMTESDLLQNDTVTVANLGTLKVSENIENVSSVTDTGLLVQDDPTEGSEEISTIPDESDTNIIPEDTHREEAYSKSSPIVHKRKMGSTRRPLKGNKGQRKGMKYHDENETLDGEATKNVEKETFSLEDEPSLDESSSQSSKDGAKEQEMEICEKKDVGPVEGSESGLIQSSFSLDSVFEESTAVTISHITESQTLTKINEESQENTGDAERVPAEGDAESHSEIQTEIKPTDLTTFEAERTEESIPHATVLVKEVEFIVDTVTVESNMTESDLLQNDTVTVANLETLKVSENIENVSSVTDNGLLVQDDPTEGSGETNTIPDESDTNIIPEDTYREETHSKSSPIVHKRKMGSTRRPLKGNKGQRKGMKYHDENETLDSEATMNVEKETFSLEDEPSLDESSSQSSKDGAKEQEMKICEKKDVGPVEGSESGLIQSSFSLDSVSEESTAVTISHITESQTLTKFNEESQENTGDAERVPAEGDIESHSEIQTQIKPTDLTTSEAERTEENICEATVLVEEVDFIVDTVTVESNMTESDLLQNDTVTVANLGTLKVSENIENVSSVTDTGLLVQDDSTEGSEETNTIPDESDTNIIPEDTHREEAHSKSSPIVHKRKMGSTRRPLKGNKGQRKGMKYHDENETLDSEATKNVEKETFSLEDEPSLDESSSQSSKDGAKEQEMEICEKKDAGPVEGSESNLIQSSFSLDSVSEESTAVTISHITESKTLTKMNEESQENTGDAERVPAEGDAESHSEIQTEIKPTDLTTFEAERTEESIRHATVLVEEVEFIVDTVTVESNMTESDLLQNDTVTFANLETLKVSENFENVSSVTDTGLLVQDDATEESGEINTIPDESDTNIIPEDTHKEETHSKSSPVVHKRKMGSTRRPLKGNKGQRKGMKYHDENETLDSEATMNVEKETFTLKDEPSLDESSSQSSKDGAKEQEMEICEKKDVGPVEGSESGLIQSSFSLDSVFEESTAVTISHITESQTLTKINEESQENTGDAERVPAEGDAESHSEIQTEIKPTGLTTSEAERTEENICEATVLVEEVDFIVDTVTVESIMTESDLLQYDTVTVANLGTLKVSENIENVSSVTDTGLLVQDDPTEGSEETNTIPDESDTNIIPEDTHREETHSKSSPIVHKRKMGSTRRPLKGNKGQRKGMKYHDENETLEDEPSLDESSSQSSKDGAKEQEMEICEKKDVGPVEGSESNLIQSSFSLDSVSEESTAVTISHITESQTLIKINEESQENTGDAERVPAEGDAESHSEIQTEIKPTDLTTFEAERTEESIRHATVLVEEVEFIVDMVTVESNMTESDLLQNDTVTFANLETLKVSENFENVSSVTDTGLLVPDDPTEGSGETNTIPDESDTNIIPEDTYREETHSKSSPIVHKRKIGSTRRPLKGNKGQRKGMKYHDENETLDSEATMNVEKETFTLKDEPSLDESSSQSSKDGAKEQEMEICEKKDVGPVEGSESGLIQSSFSLDSVFEESTAVTISHITESQTLTKINEESQENTGDAERVPAEGDAESHSEIQIEIKPTGLTTSEAERTEENICEATVLVEEVDFIVDTVTVESIMTESDLLQYDTVTVANLGTLKVSENIENVSSVTDTGLLVQDDPTEGSEETNTIPDESDTNIIPEDTHREETHSKSSPIVHKRKMGSTRRPLKGNKGQRKGMKYHDENETLEDEPSLDESSSQSSKDGAKEQEMEICEKKDVGPVEGSESNLIQSSFSLDSVSEESTAVTISHITESQTLIKINEESQDNTGDAERVPAEGDAESHSEIQTEIKPTDLTTFEAERTEESIRHATVLVEEVEFIVDMVTVESNMTESDLLQNDTVTFANLETLKVSENIENVSSVTDTGLLVPDDPTEESGEINRIPDESDANIIPEDTHREETHSKSSPVVHKRKMGSTRKPLKGNKGQRKGMKYHDENETLEYEPSLDESSSQSSKDGAKEQEMEICEKKDVGPVEGSESNLIQSSFSLDSVSEESTAVTISHITESQTLIKINEESQENTGDAERVPAEGDAESHSEIQTEIKPTDLTTFEAERTEESIPHATVLVKEVEFIVDTVTVESNMTESDQLQNDTVTVANLETLKVSENIENVSSVTDNGLLVQDDPTEGSGETNTIPDESDTNIIPEDTYREETHSKSSPIVHKRKMGSTRRPLKGNKGQRKGMKYHDENETLDSEATMNVKKETFTLKDEPSLDEYSSQSSKDGAKEQEMKICEKKDVGPVEGSESGLIQSSFSLDSVSEESTAVTISHITESQTLTKINEESQENTGDAERVPAEGDAESHSGIQIENKTIDLTSEAERTEENICEANVLVKDVEVIGDTVTVDSDMTTESDFHQNASSPDAHVEDLKVYENVENKVSEKTDTIPYKSDIDIIPEDTPREETHSKPSLIVHKRKMGSTRRPLRGDTGQRKRREYHDESETINSESMVNVEKETLSLEDEPRLDESSSQSSKDGAKEQEMEICEKTDVGPVEGSESDLIQLSFSLDSVSEESTAVTISHITESQTLTKMDEVSQEKTGDAERVKYERSDVSQTQTGPAQDDIGSHLLDVPERTADFVRDSLTSHFDLVLSDALLMEETQIHVSSEDVVKGVTCVPPTEVVEMHSVSNRSLQKRKMGSTRKRGKRIVNEDEVEEEIEGEPGNTTTDDGTIKSEEKLTHEESITRSLVHQQVFGSSAGKESHDIQDVASKSDMQTENSEQNDQNQAAEIVSELPLGDVETYSVPEQSEITSIIPEESHRKDVQSNSIPAVQKRKIGSTRKTLRGNKGQRIEVESKKMYAESKGMAKDQDTDPHLAISEGENKCKLDEQNFPVEFSHQVAISNMFSESDDGVKEVSLNIHDSSIHDSSVVSKEKGMEKTVNDSNSLNEAINLYGGTTDKCVLTVSREDIHQTMSADYLDQHVHGGSEPEQTETMFSDPSRTTGPETPENTENQLVSVDVTKHLQPETVPVEKRRKMGSTRKNVREGRIRGKRDVYEDTETAETHLQMSQDSEISLVGKAVGEQAIHDYSNQSEDSLLSEIERALNKTSQSSSNYELIVNEPNSDDLEKPENSEINSLQPKPSQSSKTHSEPNSPERRRRKMGSTRRNPRQQINAEREDEDKEDGEIEENLEANKQEIKNLERVETSVVRNIPENKLNKEYLDVPSAHTSSSQLEESSNPIVQERTSPSTKRKFGSRRTNKGKQGLGRLDASDSNGELGDEVEDNLRNDDLTVCDPHLSLQPENQPIFQPISEQSNMEARIEEAAPKGTSAGLVSLDQIIKHDRSTGTRQTINLKNRNSELQFNVVMVGNSCVGKTSFIKRFHEGQFTQDYRSTIGVDTCIQTVELPDRTVKLQIWDTAGQERFHSITTHVFHKADGLLLMYEITCSKSFISVRDWISQARERAPDDAIMILLGNKNDSVERKVQIQEGADLAREYNIHFMECSAATGANVSECMRTLAELLVQRKKGKEEHITLRREPPPKKSGCC
ncbi:uncharacterized protein rab44 [Siphateles boraxobius]|uniref:uncharacterized protein rab44 n=1 Tax=Siphateles boraxobius TaxID=180520 RepID=UPI004063C2CB